MPVDAAAHDQPNSATLTDVIPDRLAALASAQAGAFTGLQAAAHGLDRAGLSRLVRNGQVRVVRRHVYALADAMAADDTPGRVALAASARILVTTGCLVASHETAAAMRGWALLGNPPAEPQLTCAKDPRRSPPRGPGLFCAALPPGHRDTVLGVASTSGERTLADVARRLPPEAGVVTADSALRAGASRTDALALLDTCPRWPGVQRARAVLQFADARADSVLESRTRWCLAQHDLPPYAIQQMLCTEDGQDVGEVDFVWLAERTILETDGRVKYDGADRDRQGRGVVWREKLREDALRDLGFEVVRAYWSDLADGGRALAARLREAFARAERVGRTSSYGVRETARRRAQRLL